MLAEQVAAVLGLLEVMLAEPGAALEHLRARRCSIGRVYADVRQRWASPPIPPRTRGRRRCCATSRRCWTTTPSNDVAAGLAARLRRYVSGSLAGGLFAGPTNVALNRRLVVFNIQMLEEELRPLAMHLIANFVWNRVRRERRPRLLVIDEAWSLLRYPEGGAFISGMARRARKYYLGLVTITQDAADFLRSDHGRAVLVNAAMKLLLEAGRDDGRRGRGCVSADAGRAPVSAGRQQGRGIAVRSRRRAWR